jgi:hypothetical protein
MKAINVIASLLDARGITMDVACIRATCRKTAAATIVTREGGDDGALIDDHPSAPSRGLFARAIERDPLPALP